ncbi:hypothetical protein CYY_008929 [Polysphondylium violaceum]|uniref:Bax inhibitor 1 n=1 Tax=Polysphondylium violaceum TaxID=133409 RepID=A0A8J4PME4_9MYCE|nr:hypothetical protein CYY_008929 [Polysphondylium violaceum]
MQAQTDQSFSKLTAALQFSNLKPYTRDVLVKVYTSLTISIIIAAVGCFAYSFFNSALFTFGVGLGLGLFSLLKFVYATPSTNTKFKYFLLTAFCFGVLSAPSINIYAQLDPSIVMTALFATSGIFISFTIFSLLSDKRLFLMVGAGITSLSFALLILFFASFWNPSLNYTLFSISYIISVCFVIYDTQLMIYRIENHSDAHFLDHALILFFDFLDIFLKTLRLLSQKDSDNNRSSNKRRR